MGYCFGIGYDRQGGFTAFYHWTGDDANFIRHGIGLRVWRLIVYIGKEVHR